MFSYFKLEWPGTGLMIIFAYFLGFHGQQELMFSGLQGMIAGHAYYFLEDVYPRMTGRRPLKTPSFIKALFAEGPVVVDQPGNVRFAAPAPDELHQD